METIKKILYLLLMVVFFFRSEPSAQIDSLSHDSLASLLNNGTSFEFILIDTRITFEITDVIGNSRCKPYNLVWPNEFKKQCGKIAKEKVIIIYCRTGLRADSACIYLQSSGYLNVCNAGGFSDWSGDKISSAELLPDGLLPEPSMRPFVLNVNTSRVHRVNKKSTLSHLVVNNPVAGIMVRTGPEIFTIDGKRLRKNHTGVGGK